MAFWLLVAAFGPLVAHYSAGAIVAPDVFDGMSARFPLGSDYLGRDMLSRMLRGARFTVGLALAAALLASLAGTALALLAAVSGRLLDESLSRLIDALSSIPSKILALVMVAGFGSSIPLLLLTAGVTYVPGAFRIARSLAVNLQCAGLRAGGARARRGRAGTSPGSRSCRTWCSRCWPTSACASCSCCCCSAA